MLSTIASKFKREPESEYDLSKDCSIDEQIRSLYIDPDVLNNRCKFDAKKFNEKYGLNGDNDEKLVAEDEVRLTQNMMKTPENVIASLDESYFQVSCWLYILYTLFYNTFTLALSAITIISTTFLDNDIDY